MFMKQELQILVVDDEEIVRRAVKLILEYGGHKVREANGGEAALRQFAERKFDIVITDFSMPGMHGDQLIARIRQMVPGQPIILVTGFPDEYNAFGQGAGDADVLLLKPFTLGELHDAIRRVLPPPSADGINLAMPGASHPPHNSALPPMAEPV
jgi:two-component system response regulator FlrC